MSGHPSMAVGSRGAEALATVGEVAGLLELGPGTGGGGG
jgi:hypothetical protein